MRKVSEHEVWKEGDVVYHRIAAGGERVSWYSFDDVGEKVHYVSQESHVFDSLERMRNEREKGES